MVKKQLDLNTGLLADWPAEFGVEVSASVLPLNSDSTQEEIQQHFDQHGSPKLVLIEVPAFTDGRVFSLSMTLRHHFGYNGIIAATGQPIPDQLSFLKRCGFDWLALTEESLPGSTYEECLSSISVRYQPG
jgi:uncharacterized protein (DUF934 family)